MDDNDAGIASTPLRGAALAAHLAALPRSEMLPAVAELPLAAALSLTPFLPADCRCLVELAPCPRHPDQDCECPLIAAPCPHFEAALEREWPLPGEAVAILLWRLRPAEYQGPVKRGRPSRNTNPRAQVAIYAAREGLKLQLWHPRDWINLGLEALDQRITRPLRRLRNGADATGGLQLEGQDGRDAA